jgi:hypothetical protein
LPFQMVFLRVVVLSCDFFGTHNAYVDPYIDRNTFLVRGFPIREYESLPVHISMGNPHTDMESTFIGGLLRP